MNIILLRPADWIKDNIVRLTDERSQHIRNVLKSKAGDHLKVGLIGGNRGLAVVLTSQNRDIHLQVSLNEPPPSRHDFDIILALPRPKILRRVLRTAAEFGVRHLYLIHSARVEKSYWQSPLLEAEKINAALCAGLERSGDTIAPVVQTYKRFKPFVEDVLPILMIDKPCWLADRNADQQISVASGKPSIVMLGPEGGFIPYEINLARSVGCHPVNLGYRVLSVDTALATTLGQSLPNG